MSRLQNSKVECDWRQGLQQPKLFADYFAASAHNNSRERFSQSSSLCCKGVLTPYPGQFCRQLLCFDDFTAEHCL
jgi:hypothetical protein